MSTEINIDIRSDTVTRPCPAMRKAMFEAQVGDDVYGDDPSVNRLEAMVAEMTGKQAALFLTSGTQSNLTALLSHCNRGDEYIAWMDAHTYLYEAGGAAVLGGIQPQPIAFNEKGEIPLEIIERLIKPDDMHFAKTRLLCLENTVGGKVVTLSYMQSATDFAKSKGLACHLDGARAFNAAVKLDIGISGICCYFDSVSLCLSKGLGAPAGSVLVGSKVLIDRARRWRKMLGGGMRQTGFLAAAGQYALEHNVNRLSEDHARTHELGLALKALPGFKLEAEPDTNMLFLDLEPDYFRQLSTYLQESGVSLSGQRWVIHKDINDNDIERLISLCQQFVADHG